MDAILRITAVLQANADAKISTDKHCLVDELQLEFPLIARGTLFDLVESAMTVIGGLAVCTTAEFGAGVSLMRGRHCTSLFESCGHAASRDPVQGTTLSASNPNIPHSDCRALSEE